LEEHDVFRLFEDLLKRLLIEQPEDPMRYMVEMLKKPETTRIFVGGPPGVGKRTVSDAVAEHSGAVVVDADEAVAAAVAAETAPGQRCAPFLASGDVVPNDLKTDVLVDRLGEADCVTKGYVLCGYPTNRAQSVLLQMAGILPVKFIRLDASDEVVVQRVEGRQYDTASSARYHDIFKPAPDGVMVEKREGNLSDQLTYYKRNAQDIELSYVKSLCKVDADQPEDEVLAQVWTHVCTKPYSNSPTLPRLLLIGPPGSGRGTQAYLLALKYGLVQVSLSDLKKQAMNGARTRAAAALRLCAEVGKEAPDSLLLALVTDRLSQLDCQTTGWVLEGFPSNPTQAFMLDQAAFIPSRVFVLSIPDDTVKDRLSTRRIDPITGERHGVGGSADYAPPLTEEALGRLVAHPEDEEMVVEGRLAVYRTHEPELTKFYASATEINADQEPHTVFQYIDGRLVRPLLAGAAV
jgi:adenylate kinase